MSRHAPHITLLDNEVEVIDGVPFIGSTLWAMCGYGNPVDEFQIQQGMNDFRQIHISQHGEGFVTPPFIGGRHEHHSYFLRETLRFWSVRPCVVVTHHAPSLLALDVGSHGYGVMDSAYASDQHALIEENPQIALWAYGHCHSRARFRIGETTVVSNPRGYARYEMISNTFNATDEDFEIATS